MEYIWNISGVYQESIRSIRTPDGLHQDAWGSVTYSTEGNMGWHTPPALCDALIQLEVQLEQIAKILRNQVTFFGMDTQDIPMPESYHYRCIHDKRQDAQMALF